MGRSSQRGNRTSRPTSAASLQGQLLLHVEHVKYTTHACWLHSHRQTSTSMEAPCSSNTRGCEGGRNQR